MNWKQATDAIILAGALLFLGVGLFGGANCCRYVPETKNLHQLDGRLVTPEKLKELQEEYQLAKDKAERGEGAVISYPLSLSMSVVGWVGMALLILWFLMRN